MRSDDFFFQTSGPVLGCTQPPMQCVPGFFPGVKRPWRLTGHSTPTGAEIKNEYTYTSTSTIRFPGGHMDKSAVYKLAYKGNGT